MNFKHRGDNKYISKFVNSVCQLLVASTNYDILEAVKLVEPQYNYFHSLDTENVGDVPDETPLFVLYELIILNTPDWEKYVNEYNWGLTKQEYENYIKITMKACEEYYLPNKD